MSDNDESNVTSRRKSFESNKTNASEESHAEDEKPKRKRIWKRRKKIQHNKHSSLQLAQETTDKDRDDNMQETSEKKYDSSVQTNDKYDSNQYDKNDKNDNNNKEDEYDKNDKDDDDDDDGSDSSLESDSELFQFDPTAHQILNNTTGKEIPTTVIITYMIIGYTVGVITSIYWHNFYDLNLFNIKWIVMIVVTFIALCLCYSIAIRSVFFHTISTISFNDYH